MSKRTVKRIAVSFAIFIGVILLLGVICMLPFEKTEDFVADDYRYSLDYFNELDGVPIMAQETGYTCYAVSMAIVRNYLGFDTSESDLRSELGLTKRSTGLLPNDYIVYSNRAFEPLGISLSMVNPNSQAEILNVISDSLERGLPAIIFYSAKDDWNKPHYCSHYAVVYGIDMKNEIVKISNPYGYFEELSFEELYAGLDYTSYEAEPISFRLARKAGMVKNNTLFVFENTLYD